MISAESRNIILRGIRLLRQQMIDAYIRTVEWGTEREEDLPFYCRICKERGGSSDTVAHRADCDCAVFFAKCDKAIVELSRVAN